MSHVPYGDLSTALQPKSWTPCISWTHPAHWPHPYCHPTSSTSLGMQPTQSQQFPGTFQEGQGSCEFWIAWKNKQWTEHWQCPHQREGNGLWQLQSHQDEGKCCWRWWTWMRQFCRCSPKDWTFHRCWWGLISAPLIPAGIQSFRRNLVESGGIKFGRKACYFFSFRCLLFWRNLGILELRPECSTQFAGMECNGIRLFACLFVCFTPVTKQTTNQTPCDMVSFRHPPPPPLLPPHQRHPQQWPTTALPPRRRQWTTIKDNRPQLPRNDDKPPKTNTNDGQHTKMAATPKKRTTAHHHHPPQPTNDSQCPQTDTGDADQRRGTRTTMRDKGQWRQRRLSLSSSFYILYCKYPYLCHHSQLTQRHHRQPPTSLPLPNGKAHQHVSSHVTTRNETTPDDDDTTDDNTDKQRRAPSSTIHKRQGVPSTVRNHPKKEPLMHLKVWRRCGGGRGQR